MRALDDDDDESIKARLSDEIIGFIDSADEIDMNTFDLSYATIISKILSGNYDCCFPPIANSSTDTSSDANFTYITSIKQNIILSDDELSLFNITYPESQDTVFTPAMIHHYITLREYNKQHNRDIRAAIRKNAMWKQASSIEASALKQIKKEKVELLYNTFASSILLSLGLYKNNPTGIDNYNTLSIPGIDYATWKKTIDKLLLDFKLPDNDLTKYVGINISSIKEKFYDSIIKHSTQYINRLDIIVESDEPNKKYIVVNHKFIQTFNFLTVLLNTWAKCGYCYIIPSLFNKDNKYDFCSTEDDLNNPTVNFYNELYKYDIKYLKEIFMHDASINIYLYLYHAFESPIHAHIYIHDINVVSSDIDKITPYSINIIFTCGLIHFVDINAGDIMPLGIISRELDIMALIKYIEKVLFKLTINGLFSPGIENYNHDVISALGTTVPKIKPTESVKQKITNSGYNVISKTKEKLKAFIKQTVKTAPLNKYDLNEIVLVAPQVADDGFTEVLSKRTGDKSANWHRSNNWHDGNIWNIGDQKFTIIRSDRK